MIVPEAPPASGTTNRAYPEALYKRTVATAAAFLVVSSSTVAGITASTIATSDNHAASISKLSPCGDRPGICP
jgi:hypothetical protein